MSGILAIGETYTSSMPQLFAGDGDIRTDNGTFATGQNLAANTVIARISASNLIVPWAIPPRLRVQRYIRTTLVVTSTKQL
jgi:hypothetical protein